MARHSAWAWVSGGVRGRLSRRRAARSATGTLLERGLVEESGRSRFGAVLYRTTDLFQKLFGLEALDALPDVSRFDPTPEDERELRDRLLKAGEARSEPAQAQEA